MDPKEEEALLLRRRGGWFQWPMVVVWIVRGLIYTRSASLLSLDTSPSGILADIGFAIALYCMLRIYRFNKSKKLITSDLFALTRHPMYHGMFIMDMGRFFAADLTNPLFWLSWILFVILMGAAGWMQEKETLARWGDEAKAYYARTPRFVFEWLWR
jgi:protein-S-isoprenylcysteine O-methyltransferase Ste14